MSHLEAHYGLTFSQNTQALVLAAERSHVPGIRIPLVEETSQKPVLDAATASEGNGLVTSAPENGPFNKKVISKSVINARPVYYLSHKKHIHRI